MLHFSSYDNAPDWFKSMVCSDNNLVNRLTDGGTEDAGELFVVVTVNGVPVSRDALLHVDEFVRQQKEAAYASAKADLRQAIADLRYALANVLEQLSEVQDA